MSDFNILTVAAADLEKKLKDKYGGEWNILIMTGTSSNNTVDVATLGKRESILAAIFSFLEQELKNVPTLTALKAIEMLLCSLQSHIESKDGAEDESR